VGQFDVEAVDLPDSYRDTASWRGKAAATGAQLTHYLFRILFDFQEPGNRDRQLIRRPWSCTRFE
jgi:hypothetical protein